MKKKQKPELENKNHKDTVFRMLYREKKELLELYNALNGTSYTNEDELVVTTLEGETLLNMKNDVSYIFNDELNLYEHQSTPCPNIPLRDLSYVASIYREQFDISKTYKVLPLKIPTPRFVVFYNGTTPMEDEKVYKLSDMFEKKTDTPELELIVKVLNINEGHNEKLLKACKTLRGYSIFVSKVRKYIVETQLQHGKDDEEFLCLPDNSRKAIIAEAVNKAIDWCVENEVLKEFFQKYREEASRVSILEYSAEKHLQVIKDEGYDIGHEEGFQEGHSLGIQEGIQQGIQQGIPQGHKSGLDEGITGAVKLLKDMKLDADTISAKICEQYHLTPEQAKQYL